MLAQKYADGGDLLKALHHAGGRLTEHSAVSMVIQPLLSCMVYLHSKNIIHRCAGTRAAATPSAATPCTFGKTQFCRRRDIKPENILFDEGVLKVADFGLALNMNEENAVTRAGGLSFFNTDCGSQARLSCSGAPWHGNALAAHTSCPCPERLRRYAALHGA